MKLTRGEQKQYRHKRRGQDVKVSRDSWSRALRIMNTLVKSVERRGFAVTISASEDGPMTPVELCSVADPAGRALVRKVEREPAEWERRRAEECEWSGGSQAFREFRNPILVHSRARAEPLASTAGRRELGVRVARLERSALAAGESGQGPAAAGGEEPAASGGER